MSNLGGTPFDALFETLTARMGVMHTTESSPSQRTRVEWSRSGALGTEGCPYQIERAKVISRRVHPFLAAVYAPSDLEVCQLVDALEVQLEATIGPKQGIDDVRTGYRFEAGTVEPMGGDGVSAGYACDVAVTLFTLTLAEVRPLAPARASLAVTPQLPAPLVGTPITIP